ncbi:MAG: hypothetical protein JWO38_7119 [Gemmataceae bacterium]|nr:hypothetical protein [Gemmataceae bacterium]
MTGEPLSDDTGKAIEEQAKLLAIALEVFRHAWQGDDPYQKAGNVNRPEAPPEWALNLARLVSTKAPPEAERAAPAPPEVSPVPAPTPSRPSSAPTPVQIVGPNPLPVTVTGGAAPTPEKPAPAKPPTVATTPATKIEATVQRLANAISGAIASTVSTVVTKAVKDGPLGAMLAGPGQWLQRRAQGGKGGGVSAIIGMFAGKLGLLLSPLTTLTTILGASNSGMSVLNKAFGIFAATLAPILLPVFVALTAAIVAASDEIWQKLLPKLGEWYKWIIDTAIPKIEELARAAGEAAEFLLGIGKAFGVLKFSEDEKRRHQEELRADRERQQQGVANLPGKAAIREALFGHNLKPVPGRNEGDPIDRRNVPPPVPGMSPKRIQDEHQLLSDWVEELKTQVRAGREGKTSEVGLRANEQLLDQAMKQLGTYIEAAVQNPQGREAILTRYNSLTERINYHEKGLSDLDKPEAEQKHGKDKVDEMRATFRKGLGEAHVRRFELEQSFGGDALKNGEDLRAGRVPQVNGVGGGDTPLAKDQKAPATPAAPGGLPATAGGQNVRQIVRDIADSLQQSIGPKAAYSQLAEVGKQAQLAAINQDKLDAKLQLRLMESIKVLLESIDGKMSGVPPDSTNLKR